jgi:hypothetical protein
VKHVHWVKKSALLLSAFVVAIGIGAIATYAAGNKTMSDPHKATAEEYAEHLKQIQTIQTKFGIFERDDQANIEPDDVVVSDSLDVTEKTTKIVTSYGTFVRK